MPREAELSGTDRARAAWLWSRRDGVIAGLSASAMLGAKWIDAHLPAELIHTNRRPPPLITVHTDELLSGETQAIRGVPITTTDIKADDVEAVAQKHPGAREPGRGTLSDTTCSPSSVGTTSG